MSVIAGGPAAVAAVLASVSAVSSLAVFGWLLAFRVVRYLWDPVGGDVAGTVTIAGCVASAIVFVGSWITAMSSWRRILLYRKGIYLQGIVSRVSPRSDGESRRLEIHWHLRSATGRVQNMATPLPMPRGLDAPIHPASGDTVHVLYPPDRPSEAQLAGTLRLSREWHVAPGIQPPKGYDLFRVLGFASLLVLLGLAAAGITINRTLDAGYLRPWTWVVAAASLAIVLPSGLALARFWRWLPGEPWTWLAVFMVSACMGVLGAVSGANVWLDREPPVVVRARVTGMEAEYFPGWHREARVRSWRPGHVEETVPLDWRLGLAIAPGDDLLVEVRSGAFGWPVVGRVKGP